MYVLIRNQKVATYPYSMDDLKKDNPHTSFPYPISDAELVSFGVYSVLSTEIPVHNRLKQKAVEKDPILVNNIWAQVWEIVELTDDEIALAFPFLIAEYESKVTERLDSFAKTRGYNDALHCATYATSKIEKYKIEGQYMVDARDQTWFTFYQILDECRIGLRPTPFTFSEFEELLPDLVWP